MSEIPLSPNSIGRSLGELEDPQPIGKSLEFAAMPDPAADLRRDAATAEQFEMKMPDPAEVPTQVAVMTQLLSN